ncbi:MAG: hypothetical protein LC667_17545 [Thioalkalivibrio sp.]|jgi:hypothetical protein|nr:hypothetical protein [Thioalkalivibrio sp.]
MSDITESEVTEETYNNAAQKLIDLANTLSADGHSPDVHEVADGLLAGVIHFWLYSRQPCGDSFCESCAPFSDAESRLAVLRELVDELGRDSEYFHSATDTPAGHA